MAVFTDAGVAVDKTNFPNISTSYYPYGGAIALALDLELRRTYQKTLDDLMKAAWRKFGKPEIPYTVPGLQEVLTGVTGDKKFAGQYFEKYIYGHEPIDYAPLLAQAGFRLRKTEAGKAWIGNTRLSEREGLLLERETLRGTPLYDAGLDVDDKILSIDNQDVRTLSELNAILDRLHSGIPVNIRYLHRNEEKTSKIVPQENPAMLVETFESAGLPVTPDMKQFRQNWLGGK
jgi:predicted metalloprotease with PDZ domain